MSMLTASLRCRSRIVARQKRQLGVAATSFSRDSSTSTTTTTGSQPQEPGRKQKRLPLTLYRQLLQWCNTTEAGIPLEAFIEPVSLEPPQLDSSKLEELKEMFPTPKTVNDATTSDLMAQVSSLLPANTKVQGNSLKVGIQNTHELRNLIRAMFRLNANTTAEEARKKRISFAFQTLRSLNDLSTSLDDLNKHRNDHIDRDEVQYYVGQVVQHKHERWRGVIAGWEKPDQEEVLKREKRTKDGKSTQPSSEKLTSLTTKVYTASDFLSNVRYEVILDAGDVHLMQAASSLIVSTQDDLELVTDSSLCRIRNAMMSEHFKSFDSNSNTFLADDMLAYEYPTDHDIQQRASESIVGKDSVKRKDLEEIAEKVTTEIKRFARHLETLLSIPERHDGGSRDSLKLLVAINAKVCSVSSDRVEAWPASVLAPFSHQPMVPDGINTPVASTSARLRHLLNIALEVRDILWHRQMCQESAKDIKFGIGDVIYHKVYGFRGVVTAVDHKPIVDVSRWDGLVDIEDPLEKPFYHVIPDQEDCINAFGSERGLRYVCQDNMEMCFPERRALTVSLDSDWTQTFNPEGVNEFRAPSHIKFKHGIDIDDAGLTEVSLNRIQEAMTEWHVAARDRHDDEGKTTNCLSIGDLFELLKATEKLEDAVSLEEIIKEIFKAHKSDDVRHRLEDGIADVLRGQSEIALEKFKTLSAENSDYAEVWNKIAACEFMLGNMTRSLDAAVKTVDLMPLHFQAYNGKGLCEYEQQLYTAAAASFRRSLELDPWSPVSSKLAACVDQLKHSETDIDTDEK